MSSVPDSDLLGGLDDKPLADEPEQPAPISDHGVLKVRVEGRGASDFVAVFRYRLLTKSSDAMRAAAVAARIRHGVPPSDMRMVDMVLSDAMAYLAVAVIECPDQFQGAKGEFDPRLVDQDVVLAMHKEVLDHQHRFRLGSRIETSCEVAALV